MCDSDLLEKVETRGRIIKKAQLKDEGYSFTDDPEKMIVALKSAKTRACLFTFIQQPHDLEPRYSFHREDYSISMLPISTYDDWWNKQINGKTRNMVRKASKSGLELHESDLDASFIKGVVEIYNETPTRQGKRFWHYGMDHDAVLAHLDTFTDRSRFLGAYDGSEMVGFFKLTRNENSASVMQIISKISHRNKAPNNALLAKAVEMCTEEEIPFLQYGVWTAGSLGKYRQRHGFVRYDVPRYYVPLNSLGSIALRYHLYRKPGELIPNGLKKRLLSIRAAWYSSRGKSA